MSETPELAFSGGAPAKAAKVAKVEAVVPHPRAVAEMIEAAESARSEPPRLLMRNLPAGTPYPVEALATLRPAAGAIQALTQAPLAIAAQSVLAAATLAVQAHADVILPTEQAKPVSGYYLTVAASGERKSACDTEALRPIREREAVLRAEHEATMPAYLNDRDAWESERKKILGKSKSRSEKKAELDALGTAPVAPPHPMLTAQEPTLEGLHKLLAMGQPSLGVFSAEGGQFTGGHGMSDDAKLRTAAGFSALWDGTPIQRVRAVDGASVLPGRRVCLHLMAQPDVCGAFLADRVLTDQGLLSRVLVTAPASMMGTRLWRDPPASARAVLAAYADRLCGLLSVPLPLTSGKPNELRPRALPLSPDARRLWISYADSVENRVREGCAYEPIRGVAGKLPEHAARLAAVLTLAGDLGAAHIPADRLADGIALAEHYAGEALRLHEAGAGDPMLRLAQRALAWCQSKPGGLVALADLYQGGPSGIRNATAARRIVDILADHGWLTAVHGGTEVAGQFRREVWRVLEDVR